MVAGGEGEEAEDEGEARHGAARAPAALLRVVGCVVVVVEVFVEPVSRAVVVCVGGRLRRRHLQRGLELDHHGSVAVVVPAGATPRRRLLRLLGHALRVPARHAVGRHHVEEPPHHEAFEQGFHGLPEGMGGAAAEGEADHGEGGQRGERLEGAAPGRGIAGDHQPHGESMRHDGGGEGRGQRRGRDRERRAVDRGMGAQQGDPADRDEGLLLEAVQGDGEGRADAEAQGGPPAAVLQGVGAQVQQAQAGDHGDDQPVEGCAPGAGGATPPQHQRPGEQASDGSAEGEQISGHRSEVPQADL